jgi:hypothetical protein
MTASLNSIILHTLDGPRIEFRLESGIVGQRLLLGDGSLAGSRQVGDVLLLAIVRAVSGEWAACGGFRFGTIRTLGHYNSFPVRMSIGFPASLIGLPSAFRRMRRKHPEARQ